MMYTTTDRLGISTYMVTNDEGVCLLRTTDKFIANFINKHSVGVDPNLRITIGGDPGTSQNKVPLFHHIRQYYK